MGVRARHGDFHAANLTTGATVLDWEGWGRAPRGYDAAISYAYAQLAPDTAARIRRELAEFLHGDAGRAALLVVCAELLQSASRGAPPGADTQTPGPGRRAPMVTP